MTQRLVSRSVTLTRERIVAYAQQFDPQPQHLDEAAAEGTGFGALVASGWQTASLSLQLAGEVHPPLIACRYRIDSLKWLRPVRPGDSVSVEVELSADGFRITTRDAAGETVQLMTGVQT